MLKNVGKNHNPNSNKEHLEIKIAKHFKSKLENQFVVGADNLLTVIPDDDYHKKVYEFLTQNEIGKVGSDPTNCFQKQFRAKINKSQHLLDDSR